MRRQVWLVRHPPVARAWAHRCYGQSDPPLSRAGGAMLAGLAEQLAALGPQRVVHSGWRRTAGLARRVAQLAGCEVQVDSAWSERHFGTWEGQGWHAIWRETGDAMDRMMTDPHGFRPGGGETTAELAERAFAAFDTLPEGDSIVVTHGGPIAALLARAAGTGLESLVHFIPAAGSTSLVQTS
jgi:alpha-ribazole phosphatase